MNDRDAPEYRITWEQPGRGKLTTKTRYRNRKTAEEIAETWTKNIGIEHKVEQVTKEQAK